MEEIDVLKIKDDDDDTKSLLVHRRPTDLGITFEFFSEPTLPQASYVYHNGLTYAVPNGMTVLCHPEGYMMQTQQQQVRSETHLKILQGTAFFTPDLNYLPHPLHA